MLRSLFEPGLLTTGMHQLSCDVVFGSPSADCSGTGVCKISAFATMPAKEIEQAGCLHAPGVLIRAENGASVSLLFAREMLCVKLIRTQFRNGVFILNDAFVLPTEITVALCLKFNTLLPGRYPVEENGGFYRIKFH
jgi:hypothetical protein